MHVFAEICSQLQQKGLVFSADEVKAKLHNWTTKNRAEKKKIGLSGGSPSGWNLYEPINSILGSFKAYSMEQIIEESFSGDTEGVVEYLDMDDTSTSISFQDSFDANDISPLTISSQNTNALAFESCSTYEIDVEASTTTTTASTISPVQCSSSPLPVARKRTSQKRESIQEQLLKEFKLSNQMSLKEMKLSMKAFQASLELERERNEMMRDFFKKSLENQEKMIQK